MMFSNRWLPVGLVFALVVGAGCSSDDESSSTTTVADVTTIAEITPPESTDTPETTGAPETTGVPETTAPESPDDMAATMRNVVEVLASDDLAGRDNGTDGSLAAQDFLIQQLAEFADPLVGDRTDPESYKSSFDAGTNLVAVVPGTDLADEFVVVGAHYDHLGSDCASADPADTICNGATDNATGVAAALAVGRAIAADGGGRRSVIIALWDAEEDGLLGSAAYLTDPLVPLSQTVAYVNFDIQGTNISPQLRNVTVAVGAETGGANLVAATVAAAGASTLDTIMLSLLFGQGRSDHANFVKAGVPSVFLTDATPPCYHTTSDDASIVDFPKLEQQLVTATALTRDLASTDSVPTFVPDTPPSTFADAVAIHDLLVQAQPDFDRFPAADKATADQFVADLGAIVDAGPAGFGDASIGVLLGGTVQIVTLWASGECDAFLT